MYKIIRLMKSMKRFQNLCLISNELNINENTGKRKLTKKRERIYQVVFTKTKRTFIKIRFFRTN